jgi:hypothetical protein
MKKMIFLLMLLPAVLNAQFKRSATELAKENIQEYLTGKLFKNQPYQAISYGELVARKEDDPSIVWSIEHKFAITEVEAGVDKKTAVHKLHKFMFYFDNKMHVVRADSYF